MQTVERFMLRQKDAEIWHEVSREHWIHAER